MTGHRVSGTILSAKGGAKLFPDPPIGTREKVHTIPAGGETFSVNDQAFKALTLIALRHGSGNPYTFAARMLEAEADRDRVTADFRDTIGKIFRGESWRSFGCPHDEDLTRSSVQQ